MIYVELQLGSHPVAVVQYTHTHKNNTEDVTKQTIHRTTQKLGRVRAVPRLCGFYPGICLTTEEKARKNLSQGSISLLFLQIFTFVWEVLIKDLAMPVKGLITF